MKRRWAISAMLATGLALALLAPATAARANATILCDQNLQCWVNHGIGDVVTTNPYGTAWAAVDSHTQWDNHEMYYIKTGSGTCAQDDGLGTHVKTGVCADGSAKQLYHLAASGAIVGKYVSDQQGHYYCLIVEGNGRIGNFRCPSGTLPPTAIFLFITL